MFDIFEEYYFNKQLIANEIQKRNNYLSKKYPHTFSDISTYANLLDKNLKLFAVLKLVEKILKKFATFVFIELSHIYCKKLFIR